MGLADLHIHTIYSYDGTASVPAVLKRARQTGLDVIAVTDHDEIAGSLKALELAPAYGVEVIPGTEVTTSEGDLLALNVTEKIPHARPLVETILKVGESGGFCIAPHPMAGGFGMKSLSAYSILKALRNTDVARILAERLDIAQTASSDAHVVEAIGLGATEFEGRSAQDLVKALKRGDVRIRKQKEWTSARILGSWAANYLGSAFTRLAGEHG